MRAETLDPSHSSPSAYFIHWSAVWFNPKAPAQLIEIQKAVSIYR